MSDGVDSLPLVIALESIIEKVRAEQKRAAPSEATLISDSACGSTSHATRKDCPIDYSVTEATNTDRPAVSPTANSTNHGTLVKYVLVLNMPELGACQSCQCSDMVSNIDINIPNFNIFSNYTKLF